MNGWLFDVRDFGAKGDGTTNDSPAFQAAMEAMGPVTSGQARHGTLFVSPGDYLLADDLKIERAIKLVGVAPGSGHGKSRLLFAPYKGIRTYDVGCSPRGGDANYAVIEDLDIVCGHPLGSAISAPNHAIWQRNTRYNLRDKILPAVDRQTRPGSTWEYYYECVVKTGTSGDVEPDWTLVQGIDQATEWQPATDYYYSSVVRAPEMLVNGEPVNRYDVYFTPASPSYDITRPATPDLLQGSIKSGSIIPTQFATAEPGDIVEELNSAGQTIIWHCYSTGSKPPRWQPERRYKPGTIVRSSTRGDALFKLLASGTTPDGLSFRTGSAEPTVFATVVPGPNVDNPTAIDESGLDGTLQWGCYFDPTIWRANTNYEKSRLVRPVKRYDVVSLENPTSVKTGNEEPTAFANAKPGDLINEVGSGEHTLAWRCHSDGAYLVGDGRTLSPTDRGQGPIWACRVAAAIYAQARITVNRVFIQAALNAGLHVQASAYYLPPSNANGFTVFKLDVFRCGCGIVTRGDDCNASTVVHAQILLFDKSDKEVGVAERGFLGNHYYSCSVDACKGPAYLVTSGVNFGGLHGCYSEGGTGPIHIASPSFTVFGGDYGSRFTRESQGWVIENRLSIPPFWVVNEQGPKRAETYVGYDGGSNAVFGWSSAFDPHYWLLRYYDDEKVWSTEWANSRLFRANYLTGSDEHPRGGGMQGFSHFLLGVANNKFQPKLPIKVSADTQKPPPNHNAIVKASEQPKWALHKKGDIVFNADPKPGDATDSNHQYIGWVCIDDTDDNNQIWKGFGKIES